MSISRCLSSSETLTPSTLAALALMMPTAVSIAVSRSSRAPVAGQRRIEHVAEPVDDHGLADLRQHAVIDLGVVVGAAAELCQRARGHQDDAAAGLLDRRDLLLIGADHVVDASWHPPPRGDRCRRRKTPARRPLPSPPRTERWISSSEVGQSSPMPRCAVSIASATPRPRSQICSRNAMVRSQSIADVEPRIVVGERIGDHMRGRERHAVERAFELGRKRPRRRQAIGLDRTIRRRQFQRQRRHRHDRSCSWLRLLTP